MGKAAKTSVLPYQTSRDIVLLIDSRRWWFPHGLPCSDKLFVRMQIKLIWLRSIENFFRLRDFRGGSVDDQHKFIALDCCLVLNNAVLWNAYTVESRSRCAQTADYRSAFQCAYYPRYKRPCHENWPDTRNCEEGRAEQQAPKTSPESARLAPSLHSVACIVVAHYLLVGVEILRDD